MFGNFRSIAQRERGEGEIFNANFPRVGPQIEQEIEIFRKLLS